MSCYYYSSCCCSYSCLNGFCLLQDWWDDKLPESGIMSCLSVIPKVLLAGAITLMDEAYYKLAVWLNDRGRTGEKGRRKEDVELVSSCLVLFWF